MRPLCGIWLLPLLKFPKCHGLYSAIELDIRINVNTQRSLTLFKMMDFKLAYLCPYSTLICLQNQCKHFFSHPKTISSLTPVYSTIAYLLHWSSDCSLKLNWIWCHHSSLAHAMPLAFSSLLQYLRIQQRK